MITVLKIDVLHTGTDGAEFRLEGRVIGRWVEELRRACTPVLARGTRLTLDLGEVTFLDRDGAELLLGLPARQVVLLNCSAFLSEQLKAYGG